MHPLVQFGELLPSSDQHGDIGVGLCPQEEKILVVEKFMNSEI
jgi:hypothetical protein